MIDLNLAQQEFNTLLKDYDLTNEMISLKVAHMLRVENTSINIAKRLNLDEENVNLAGVIGLLHDIGRFVQVKKYGTFIDAKSINHSIAGVDLLFKEGLISKFVKDEKYYYTIEKAIANHGNYAIEDGINDENTLLHAKIIRDSDKLDIYEVVIRENLFAVFDDDYDVNADIAEEVLKDFYNHKLISNLKTKTVLDDYVRKVAFLYDFNFKESLKIIKDKDYINKITEKFIETYKFQNPEALKHIYEVRDFGLKYLDENIK